MPHFEFVVPSQLVGERLDRAVAQLLDGEGVELSNSKAKRLVEGGDVRIDGREAWKSSRDVREGWTLSVDVPPEFVRTPSRDRLDISDRILHADEWLVAVNKPPGIPTHATHDPDRDHVRAAVRRWLREEGDDDPYVGVHHRLDVDTTGVLVFARSREANKGLADAFSGREVSKRYLALVAANPALPDDWTMETHIGRDRHEDRMRSVHSGGDYARTEFAILGATRGVARIEARPATGRRHQIRVHLVESGAPIAGDVLYGGPTTIGEASFSRPMLHAWKLQLAHPVTGDDLQLLAKLPGDWGSG